MYDISAETAIPATPIQPEIAGLIFWKKIPSTKNTSKGIAGIRYM